MNKNNFADIYSKWEQSHNENAAIAKRISTSEKQLVHKKTINELRRMKVQDELDLHNYLMDSAVASAESFLKSSYNSGKRKIRIITGKGLHSPNGEAVIRPAVLTVVKNSVFVREYDENPQPEDGGSGAIIIIIKEKQR